MAVSRARIKNSVATMLSSVSGISSGQVYTYEPSPDTSALQGQTYAIVDVLQVKEAPMGGNNAAPYNRLDVTVVIHLVQRAAPIALTDNTTRASLDTAFDTVKDAIQNKVRASGALSDGSGRVFQHFGDTVETMEGIIEYRQDRTLLECYFAVKGWIAQF